MHNPPSLLRRAWLLPAAACILSGLSSVQAAPTAVNDSFSTLEDTALNVTTGGTILSANFDATAENFVYADNTFGTTSGNNATGSRQATGGLNGTGGLFVDVGGNPPQVGQLRPASGGWRRTFNLASATTVRFTGQFRLRTRGGLETNEWGDFIVDVDGTRYGPNGTAPALYIRRLVGPNVENANNNLTSDTDWQPFSQDVSLAAGDHTLTLGIYSNSTTVQQEHAELYLDDVAVAPASGGSGALGVLANDTGTAPVTAVKDTNPAHGSVTLNANGTFTYTPVANYSGADSFTYHASDSTGNSAPATVNITVTPVNDAPVAVADSYSTNEDTPLAINAPGLTSNDTDADAGTTLTAALRSPPGKGAVTVNTNGSFTYTPNANANGPDSFTYRVNDGTVNSPDATVSITINPINDAPIGIGDSYRTPVNTPLNVTLTSPVGQPTTTETLVAAGSPVPPGDPAEADLPVWRYLDDGSNQGTNWRTTAFNDSTWSTGKGELGYGDGPERTIVGFGPDANNKFPTTYFRTTFQVIDKSSLSGLKLHLMRDDAAIVYLNGTEIYRDQSANGFPDLPSNPAFDAYCNGTIGNADEATLVDLSSFLVTNAAQFLVEGANVLAVEVHQANGPSTDLSMDLRLTAERGPYAGVLYNDVDPDGTTPTAQIVTNPAHGSLTLNANGTFLYTPAASYTGPDSFVYRATDGTLNSANTTVTLTVASAGNAPPLAANDSYSTNEDVPLNISAPGVLANDSDPEGPGLTAQGLTNPAHGSLTFNTDGSFLYTPVANYNGPDSFTYRARDLFNANSAAATVSLTVTAVNDAPVAAPETYGTDIGVTLNVSAAQGVLANDTDVEGTTLTAQIVSLPASGTLTLNPNGSFTYVPPAGFSGSRTFTYRASDGTTTSNTVTVTINMNGAPTAGANSYTTAEDTPLTITAPGVLANDTDPESQPLTAVNATQPAHGSVSLNTNGSFTYTPVTNYAGADSFTYQASDGIRFSAPGTVSITVTAVNDAPVAQNDNYVAIPGQTLTVAAAQGVLFNDSDAENSPLSLTLLSTTTSGVLTLAPNGSFSYVPNAGFTGVDFFTYRISDGTLNSLTATATINVKQPGDDIVINEIMYRSGGGFPEDTNREWIELYNRGTSTIDLTGWTISSGVTFAFPAGRTMAPNSYLVVAANLPAFQAANPSVTNVVAGWTGSLSNGGERIRLTDALGNDLDEVSYASDGDWATRVRETTFNGWAWSTLADGGGRSMSLRNAKISNDNGQNWTVSSTVGGTPGAVNDVLSTNIPPIIKGVKHSPPVPTTTDRVRISCELNDESAFSALNATLFWRNATTTTPPAFSSMAMSQDGKGEWFAQLDPQATNLTIIEFYISATDGTNTRTWPAPTSEGQNANCQFQVSNEALSPITDNYWLVLTAAEHAAFVTTTGIDNSGNKVDREFNNTLIVVRGGESEIRYRCDMRIRGNSSRDHTSTTPAGQPAPPMRVSIPSNDALDGSTKFNLGPRNAYLQYFGMRIFQAAGVRAPDVQPVELRRNGVEYTRASGTTADFGMWVRMEDISGEMVNNHWPLADSGGTYKKGRNDYYWRATQAAPTNPDAVLDGFLKQNNSAANDWSDLRGFFSTWMAACAPHFPTSNPLDVAGSGGASTSGIGNWNSTAFSDAEIASVETVADLDQWARWFAVMTVLSDNETNVSNGQDDDYGVYFEPRTVGVTQQRRLQFIPHDLDTIFGLGDSPLSFNSIGLYDMTEQSSVFRPLLPLFGNSTVPGNAAFRAKYFDALRELFGTVFDADTTSNPNPPFYQMVDYHLGNWAPAATRTAIKDFVRQRRTYLLGLMAQSPIVPPAGTSHATVTSAHGTLFISEVFAHNVSNWDNSGTFPDVIELQNTGSSAVSLAGMSLTDDPLVKDKFVFGPGTTLAAGTRLVLYADDAETPAPGTHLGFGLDDDGETVYLYNTVASGQGLVDSITYGLQPANFSIGRTGPLLDTWELCTPSIGSANTPVAALAPPSGVRINEWLGNADYRASDDFIELYNGGGQPVALGGMRLTDDFINYPARHVIPQLSFMAAGGFVSFEAKGSEATPGNARELPFNINSSTGNVALLGANGTIVDRGDTMPQFRDISIGRLPDGTGAFTAMAPPSPGYTNASLAEGALDLLNNLRITEMMYNPSSSANSEYIEFRNISDSVTLDLSGVTFTNGITFTFPASTTLAPGTFIVIVESAAKFSAQFPLITVGGVYTGKLDNSGERIRFTIPGVDIPILDFSYNDSWYPSTDGGGDSLQIVNAAASPAMWDRSEGWHASPPNPGSVPPYGVYAGADFTAPAGVPVFLDGTLNPGTFVPSSVSLLWTRESGPAAVPFTTPACEDANAVFPVPGVYVLRLTAVAAGPTTVTDLVTVTVYETYDTWAATALASQSPANRLPGADPDGDGVNNLAEWVLNGNPLNSSITGAPVPSFIGGLLTFTWQRNLQADPNVTITPQLSTNLAVWQEGPAVLSTQMTGATSTAETWVATETGTPGARSKAFVRLKVESP